MVKQITKYEAADGREFLTKEAAEEHDMVLELAELLDTQSSICWHDTGAYEVAEWLIATFDITPKVMK